ncbi:MAG: hypothetical protein QM764_12865 [Chitinophagaceae bacterium]
MKVAKQQAEWDKMQSYYEDKILKLQSILRIAERTYGRTHSPRVAERIAELRESIVDNTNAQSEMSRYFIPVKNDISFDELHEMGYKTWKYVPEIKHFSEADKDRYESFAMGFLTYYELYGRTEEEIKQGTHADHTLYFDWGETRPGEFDLIVYLTPLDVEVNEYDGKGDANFAGATTGKPVYNSPLAPPPSSDPGPLPGPPPPPKQPSGKTS